jgi:RNA polymerase sigma-70 factor (ECF subfamily)
MPENNRFLDLLRRVRAGDQQAAAELVREYEPTIQRMIHVKLRDPRLRRAFDTQDICQSVLAGFFVRTALGSLRVQSPADLLKFLAGIIRKKVAFRIRGETAECRDVRRIEGTVNEMRDRPAGGSSPSQHVAGQELLERFRERLTPEERRLAELRQADLDWKEIAAQTGGTPDGERKKLDRAIERVLRELGLDEASHE